MPLRNLKYAGKIEALFVPVFVLIAIGLFLIYRIAVGSLVHEHAERLVRTARLTDNGLTATEGEMVKLVKLFQANRTLKEYLYLTVEFRADEKPLRNLVSPLAMTLAIDEVELYDRNGRMVVDFERHEDPADERKDRLTEVTGTLPKDIQSGFHERSGIIEITAIAPLTDGSRLIGYIKAGTYITGAYLDLLKKLSGNDILLVEDGVIFASTVGEMREGHAYALRNGFLAVGDRRYTVHERSIRDLQDRPLGTMVVALPRKDLEEAVMSLRLLMAGMLIVAGLVSFGLARLFLRTLVDPLQRIALFAERVSRGELDDELAFSGRDEISLLGRDLNKMRQQLKADQELKAQYTSELEQRVEERTAELKKAQEQLLHAHKMEAVGQMAGGLAHDFNNILMAIMGYAGILQKRLPSQDPLRQYVDQMVNASRRAANLTHGLLAFSRKQVLHPRDTDLNDIVLQVEKLLQRLVGEDIEFNIALDERALTIKADRGQIEQVLMNLVTNARDAMPRGGRLAIRTGSVNYDDRCIYGKVGRTEGEFAMVSVTDTGTGMNEETRRKIFEPFFTTKETGKGTGLGLAMVYGIVQQHDGCITVESAPGAGTTFTVYFPLIAASDQSAEQGEQRPAPQGGAETILVGEDDGDIRELTRTGLEEAGYTVLTAVDGEDAIAKFMRFRHRIDLLVLDVVMPKRNGREVLDEARAAVPGVKAIFVSGHSADILRRKGVNDNGNGSVVLMKPVDLEALLQAVREALDRKT